MTCQIHYLASERSKWHGGSRSLIVRNLSGLKASSIRHTASLQRAMADHGLLAH